MAVRKYKRTLIYYYFVSISLYTFWALLLSSGRNLQDLCLSSGSKGCEIADKHLR